MENQVDEEPLVKIENEEIKTITISAAGDCVLGTSERYPYAWGKEFKHYPLLSQKELAHFVIEYGADLILGHHPHVIQGIESFNNKNIVYSLGNFCFGGLLNPKDKDTFIYQHTFTFRNGELIKETSKIIPCSISSIKERNNYQPTPMQGLEKKRVLKRIQEYSKNL